MYRHLFTLGALAAAVALSAALCLTSTMFGLGFGAGLFRLGVVLFTALAIAMLVFALYRGRADLRAALTVFVLGLTAVTLAACANGQLSATATQDINTALADACPPLNVLQADVAAGTIKLNKYQQAAVNSLANACPPNPPPTNATTAAIDVLSAVAILQPLFTKK